ncbi:MAG: hypothetical protein AB1633_02010 [Elusimicrobiota bacterium]
MKKIKYYIETTVFNFIFAEDEPTKKRITEEFFKSWQNLNGEMYISNIVIAEINRAPEELKLELFRCNCQLEFGTHCKT